MKSSGQWHAPKFIGEAIIGFILMALGLWWAWQAYGLGLAQFGEIGPGAFPFGVGLLLAAGGVGCALRAIGQQRARAGDSPPVVLDKAAFALFGVTALFGAVFAWVSPLLACLVFIAIMLVWQGKMPIARSVLVASIISLILYVVFDRLLGVQLPSDYLVQWIGL